MSDLPTGFQAVTPDQLADRAAFAEITDEDPRSYRRAVEHQTTRGPAPVRVSGWSGIFRTLAEEMDER